MKKRGKKRSAERAEKERNRGTTPSRDGGIRLAATNTTKYGTTDNSRSRLSWPVFEGYWGAEISKTCGLRLARASGISQAFDLRSVYMCVFVYLYYKVTRLSITKVKVILFRYAIALLEQISFYAFLFLWRKNIKFITIGTNGILQTVLNVLHFY